MTPEEVLFNDEIERAHHLARGDSTGYWDGYITGLMRAFFGECAVSDRQHEALSELKTAAAVTRGYCDGHDTISRQSSKIDVARVLARLESHGRSGVSEPPAIRHVDLET